MPDLAFEGRLAEVLRADAERAVRPIDAVSIAVGATLAPRRAQTRWAVRPAIALALLVLGTVLAVYVAGALRDDPDPITSHTRPVVFDANGWLLGASVWAADAEPIEGLGIAGRIHLVIGYGGATASIRDRDDAQAFLGSDVTAGNALGELEFTLARNAHGCRAGDVGTYQALSDDEGQSLRLQTLVDPCAMRSAAFERVWVRTLRLRSNGGSGFIDALDPNLQLTLATGTWGMSAFADGFTMSEDLGDVGFEVVKDPQGMTDPCRDDGGAMISIPPGADAFIAYVDGLPGVEAVASDARLGGYPARRIVATWDRPLGCPETRVPVAWRLNQPTLHRLGGGLTGAGVIYVVEAHGATLVITAGVNGEAIAALDVLPGLPPATGPP